MATYSARVITSTRYEWVVPAHQPWGAVIAEVYKAVSAAEHCYKTVNGKAPGSDDWCGVFAGDDEIIVAFTVESEKAR